MISKRGDLDIILYDSEGNEVYELDGAKELETFFNLSNSDTYTLVADCSNFTGSYSIKVYKVIKQTISNKSLTAFCPLKFLQRFLVSKRLTVYLNIVSFPFASLGMFF